MTDSTSSPRALVDTNVVVYAYDVDEPRKHGTARELLKRPSDEGRLGFSVQDINEGDLRAPGGGPGVRPDARRAPCVTPPSLILDPFGEGII